MDQVEKYRKSILSNKIGIISFLWVLIFLGFFTYIFEISIISTKGFKVTELERAIKSAETTNKKQRVDTAILLIIIKMILFMLIMPMVLIL